MSEKILNLGCGSNYIEGAVNVDHPGMKGKVKADVWYDLEKCVVLPKEHRESTGIFMGDGLEYALSCYLTPSKVYPAKYEPKMSDLNTLEDHFDKIILRHVFEHVRNVIPMMEEIYRLLKPGGTVEITCPYWTSIWAWGDIGHVRAVNEMSFVWFSKEHYKKNREENTSCSYYEPDCDFEIKDIKLIPTTRYKPHGGNEMAKAQKQIAIMEHKDRHLNVIEEIKVVLEAIK